jgi:hypothetical protein
MHFVHLCGAIQFPCTAIGDKYDILCHPLVSLRKTLYYHTQILTKQNPLLFREVSRAAFTAIAGQHGRARVRQATQI